MLPRLAPYRKYCTGSGSGPPSLVGHFVISEVHRVVIYSVLAWTTRIRRWVASSKRLYSCCAGLVSYGCLIAAEPAICPILEGYRWPNWGIFVTTNAFPNETLWNFTALFLSPFCFPSAIILGCLPIRRHLVRLNICKLPCFAFWGGALSLTSAGFRSQGVSFVFES